MMIKFDRDGYKKRLVEVWNEVAPSYHSDWASKNNGPFKSTSKLVKTSGIKKGDFVLDLACGTGVVTKKILSRVGKKGRIIGVDISQTPIKIAKDWIKAKNVEFVNLDAEKIDFNYEFDAVTCQYGLMFFPDVNLVLTKVRRMLKEGGKITVAVHGDKISVPYFSCISKPMIKYIPDFFPPGAPTVHRFGTKMLLGNEFEKTGFKGIKIKEYCFEHSPGPFKDYWEDYFKHLSTPLKEKIKNLNSTRFVSLKKEIEKNTKKFLKNGKIVFPWKILVLTAVNPKKLGN